MVAMGAGRSVDTFWTWASGRERGECETTPFVGTPDDVSRPRGAAGGGSTGARAKNAQTVDASRPPATNSRSAAKSLRGDRHFGSSAMLQLYRDYRLAGKLPRLRTGPVQRGHHDVTMRHIWIDWPRARRRQSVVGVAICEPVTVRNHVHVVAVGFARRVPKRWDHSDRRGPRRAHERLRRCARRSLPASRGRRWAGGPHAPPPQDGRQETAPEKERVREPGTWVAGLSFFAHDDVVSVQDCPVKTVVRGCPRSGIDFHLAVHDMPASVVRFEPVRVRESRRWCGLPRPSGRSA